MNTTFSAKESLAAKNSRALDIIEDILLNHSHETDYTGDLIVDISRHMADPTNAEKGITLERTARLANLSSLGKVIREVRDSQQFQDIVADMPDMPNVAEDTPSVPEAPKSTKGSKSAKASKSTKGSKGAKASKKDVEEAVVPMPEIADIEALETLASNRKALVAAMKAINVNITTNVRANAATKAIVEAIARHVLKVEGYVYSPPSKAKGGKRQAKAKQQLPMPAIPTIADLEAMDRKALMSAAKAVNTHVETGVKANGKTVDIQQMLAREVVGVADYVPTPKTKATAALMDITDLTWAEAKDMGYRQLQQVCKALRAQGYFEGNIGGKGATKEALRKGVADYFKSQGEDIVEANVTPAAPKKDLNLAHWNEYKKQYKLSQQATALIAQADAAEAAVAA